MLLFFLICDTLGMCYWTAYTCVQTPNLTVKFTFTSLKSTYAGKVHSMCQKPFLFPCFAIICLVLPFFFLQKTVDMFLDGETSVEDFMQKFLKEKTLHHMRHVKTEKLAELVKQRVPQSYSYRF